jgi:hypothetical protein
LVSFLVWLRFRCITGVAHAVRAHMSAERGTDALQANAGVLQSVFVLRSSSIAGMQAVREAVGAAEHLSQTMRPRYPLELHANAVAMGLIRRYGSTQGKLWQRVLPLSLPPNHRDLLQQQRGNKSNAAAAPASNFVHKLAALASTRYQRALFLDNDVRGDAMMTHPPAHRSATI